MTNEDAIKHLQTYSTTMGSGQTTDEQHNEAKKMAIKALTELDNNSTKVDRGIVDLIYRQDAIDVANRLIGDTKFCKVGTMSFQDGIIDGYCRMRSELLALPYAQPDNRLAKIADLVEGTIDHFDLDDAMDLLYQIKEVIGEEE